MYITYCFAFLAKYGKSSPGRYTMRRASTHAVTTGNTTFYYHYFFLLSTRARGPKHDLAKERRRASSFHFAESVGRSVRSHRPCFPPRASVVGPDEHTRLQRNHPVRVVDGHTTRATSSGRFCLFFHAKIHHYDTFLGAVGFCGETGRKDRRFSNGTTYGHRAGSGSTHAFCRCPDNTREACTGGSPAVSLHTRAPPVRRRSAATIIIFRSHTPRGLGLQARSRVHTRRVHATVKIFMGDTFIIVVVVIGKGPNNKLTYT